MQQLFFAKMKSGSGFGAGCKNPGSKIREQKLIFAESKKILWLDIEMRCAVCAAAKVENYF